MFVYGYIVNARLNGRVADPPLQQLVEYGGLEAAFAGEGWVVVRYFFRSPLVRVGVFK